MNLFINLLFTEPRLFFTQTFIVVFSICCHEFCHAWTALKFGDPTAADAGHLTLNPLRQMGWFSLFMLAVLGIAWGQVPVNPVRMRGRLAPAAVAAAGPLCNLALSVIFVVGAFFYRRLEIAQSFSFAMLVLGGVINLILFILNMLPLPGLDGWAILKTFFPRILTRDSELIRGVMFSLIILLFAFFSALQNLALLIVSWEMKLLGLFFS